MDHEGNNKEIIQSITPGVTLEETRKVPRACHVKKSRSLRVDHEPGKSEHQRDRQNQCARKNHGTGYIRAKLSCCKSSSKIKHLDCIQTPCKATGGCNVEQRSLVYILEGKLNVS